MRRLSKQSQRFLARVHFWMLGFSLFGYLALAFMLGPGFLSFDVAQKIRVLADEMIVVTAVVLGPPVAPTVTAAPACVSGAAEIRLDWADDAATTSFEIERDGLTLVAGLASSEYTDTGVVGGTSYSYVVTATGPMAPGTATSLPVSATAIECGSLLPDPTVTVSAIGTTSVTPPRPETMVVSGDRPRLSGTTNVSNALIDIRISRPTMIARVTANSNGYFTWRPPRALQSGNHYLVVTATDPLDGSRTATDSLNFFRKEDDDDDEKDPAPSPVPPSSSFDPSFDFALTLQDEDATLRQGDRLEFSLTPIRGLFPLGTPFEIALLDDEGAVLYEAPDHVVAATERPGLVASLRVPRYLPEGAYRLEVTATFGDMLVSRSAPFALVSLPLLYLGNKSIVTYGEAASFLGWIFFLSLTFFFLFLFFLLREYWLYLHGVRFITERGLKRFGFILERKEVRK